MKAHDRAFNTMPVESERMSASEFLHLVETHPALIKSSRPAAPDFDSSELGAFDVVYTRPVYKNQFDPTRN